MYGLKQQPVNIISANYTYGEAAKKFQPEAITQTSISVYMTLLQTHVPALENYVHPTLPLQNKLNADKFQVEKMWHWLEKAAIIGWISPFLVFQVEQTIRLDMFQMPIYVKDAMERRRTGEELEELMTNFEVCANCDSMNFAPEHLVFCNICLKEHYCSERCKHNFNFILKRMFL